MESTKHLFKDPDSLKVVKNLGSRGQSVDENSFFWLRFTATNSYGGRVAASMACRKEGDIWIRDSSWEERTAAKLQALMDARLANLENAYVPPDCSGVFGCAEAQAAGRKAAAESAVQYRREKSSFGREFAIQGASVIGDLAD